jgi:translation elongation factor EF-Tu-like GTPase
MLAGAGGIDCVMLVISAEDGVKPQTLEHLAICWMLGITCGLTILTKIDAVDEGRLREPVSRGHRRSKAPSCIRRQCCRSAHSAGREWPR